MQEYRLEEFESLLAAEVLSWICSAEELNFWAARSDYPLTETSVFTSWHSDPDIKPYVLFSGENCLGYGELWLEEDERSAELARLLVSSDCRRTGIGMKLVGSLIDKSREFEAESCWVRVFPKNQPALGCYKKAGFRRISTEEEERYNAEQRQPFHWMTRTP